jgi:hypothetical protein
MSIFVRVRAASNQAKQKNEHELCGNAVLDNISCFWHTNNQEIGVSVSLVIFRQAGVFAS